MLIRAAFIPALFLGTFVLAQDPKANPAKADDDPIAAQLLKDKEAYAAILEKAREEFVKGFDKYYDSVKNNKSLKLEAQLAQLEKIEAEKKAFEENSTIPSSVGMKTALSEYRTTQKKAETVCKAAFEKAAKSYRDKGDVKAAGLVLEEMKEFLAKDPLVGGGTAGAAGALVARHSNKVIAPNGTDDGAKVLTADFKKGEQLQLWRTSPAGDGYLYIENVKTGMVMTATGKNNGDEVIVSKKISPASDTQLWKMTPVAGQPSVFKVFSKGANNKSLDVNDRSKNAGVKVQLWTDQNQQHEMFGFLIPK